MRPNQDVYWGRKKGATAHEHDGALFSIGVGAAVTDDDRAGVPWVVDTTIAWPLQPVMLGFSGIYAQSTSMYVTFFGPAALVYPFPHHGLSLGIAGGFGFGQAVDAYSWMLSAGARAFVGYGVWVSDEWTAGLKLNAITTLTDRDRMGSELKISMASLTLDFTYN